MRKRIALYLIPSLVVMLIGAFLLLYYKPHRSIADEAAAFQVSASELTEAFSRDEARADSLYTGKVIEVNGTLREVIRNDSTWILMISGTDAMMGVSCFLERSQEGKTEKLTPGELITVKGICNGMLLDVVLDKGVLLKDKGL